METVDEMRFSKLEQQLRRVRQDIESVERQLPRGAPDGSVRNTNGLLSAAAGSGVFSLGGSNRQNTRDVWLCSDAVPELVTFLIP